MSLGWISHGHTFAPGVLLGGLHIYAYRLFHNGLHTREYLLGCWQCLGMLFISFYYIKHNNKALRASSGTSHHCYYCHSKKNQHHSTKLVLQWLLTLPLPHWLSWDRLLPQVLHDTLEQTTNKWNRHHPDQTAEIYWSLNTHTKLTLRFPCHLWVVNSQISKHPSTSLYCKQSAVVLYYNQWTSIQEQMNSGNTHKST